MRSINKVILIGNVGKDPDVRVFESGNKNASFSLATTERYRDKAGVDQSITDWHNIVAWGPQADIIEKYVRKGTALYIEGRIRYREYEDKEGVKRRITDIILDNFSMLSSRSSNEQSNVASSSAEPNTNVNDDPLQSAPDDDLPF